MPSANKGPPANARTLARPRIIGLGELARYLSQSPCTILTGAGISHASGIRPFMGPGSLDESIPLTEPFPGEALDWMVQRPAELASLVESFQASVATARPNPAHRCVAELEARGFVDRILTSNFDALHQAAGNVHVRRLDSSLKDSIGSSGGPLLVVGVARDDFGLIATARAAGSKIIVIGPEIPQFADASDLYLPGQAEIVLPEVAALVGLTRTRETLARRE